MYKMLNKLRITFTLEFIFYIHFPIIKLKIVIELLYILFTGTFNLRNLLNNLCEIKWRICICLD